MDIDVGVYKNLYVVFMFYSKDQGLFQTGNFETNKVTKWYDFGFKELTIEYI